MASPNQMMPGAVMTFSREDAHFFAQFPGQPRFEIFPASEREFFLMVFDARFTFEVNDRGRATAVIVHTDRDQRAARIP